MDVLEIYICKQPLRGTPGQFVAMVRDLGGQMNSARSLKRQGSLHG